MGVVIFIAGCFVGAIITIFSVSMVSVSATLDVHYKSTDDKSPSERIEE